VLRKTINNFIFLQTIKLNHDTKSKERYDYAALPYTNGPIHIGHLAGVYVPSDIYSRYLRLKRCFVCVRKRWTWCCHFDESQKEGITPQEVIDKYDGIIRKSFIDFDISFDNYSRTSAKIHHDTASEFFTTLYEKGDFIEQVTEQLYDAKADQFLADRFVIGTCPKWQWRSLWRP
jgi:methionyl-tRNA synthetase